MRSVIELEERLSRPSPPLVDDLSAMSGDILVLGAGGKLGPSLVRLALRGLAEAGSTARVIAVSRFSDAELATNLREAGAEVVRADASDERALASLPDADNVLFLVGAKFGTTGHEHRTWATNAFLPGLVAGRYAGSRIVALSTGNVYPLAPVTSGGCRESDPVGPVGEYAMSCLGRERVLTSFAERDRTPMALIRLNYAVELRYGVLSDLARAIHAGAPIDVTTGHVNIAWQGYVNEVILRSLRHTAAPPFVLNVTGEQVLPVRELAADLGRALGREPVFAGSPADTALLSDAWLCHEMFGKPDVSVTELVEWTAEWVAAGGPDLGKPTHFQSRDGRF